MSKYDEQAAEFLSKNGMRFRAVRHGGKCPAWAGEGERMRGDCPECHTIHGDFHRVTIWREAGGPRLAFDFWGSQADAAAGVALTAYSVLACISGDIYTPDTFEEFCSEYGYDADSRKALSTFKRCARFADRMRAFFSEAEQRELSEIS